jgi:hypothetical protein
METEKEASRFKGSRQRLQLERCVILPHALPNMKVMLSARWPERNECKGATLWRSPTVVTRNVRSTFLCGIIFCAKSMVLRFAQIASEGILNF